MQFPLKYPVDLDMEFKMDLKTMIRSPRPIVDADDETLGYLWSGRRLRFKKFEGAVFEDAEMAAPAFNIRSYRTAEGSARCGLFSQSGVQFASIRRTGIRSVWMPSYELCEGDSVRMHVRAENPVIRHLESLFGAAPVVGFLSSSLFHPRYVVSVADGRVVMRMYKEPKGNTGIFRLEKYCDMDEADERMAFLGLVMTAIREWTVDTSSPSPY